MKNNQQKAQTHEKDAEQQSLYTDGIRAGCSHHDKSQREKQYNDDLMDYGNGLFTDAYHHNGIQASGRSVKPLFNNHKK